MRDQKQDPNILPGEVLVPPGRLFAEFLRLGLTAFGGPAMVAYIRDLAVKKRQWLPQEAFEDGAALCQSIPGATAMQSAAYVGLRAGGPFGALAAFVGFGLPAWALMIALSVAYRAGQDIRPVLAAFRGLHVIVVAIVVNAAIDFGRKSVKNWRDAMLTASAAAFLVLGGSPVLAVVLSAAIGIFAFREMGLPARAAHTSVGSGRQALRVAAVLTFAAAVGLLVLFLLNRVLFDLAALMAKVDLFAFGGGFASVPLMLHEVVDVRHWLDARTFMDGMALGQATPGPIVITATFVGHQIAGLPGAVVGTIGVFTPSFLMVLIAVPYADRLQHSVPFRRALRGVLASFVGLLAAVAVNFGRSCTWSAPTVLIATAALVALRLKVDILWVVLVGAAVSVFVV